MTKLVKASIWLSLSEIAFNLSGYVIHAILGRYLGPAEYGRYSLIVTFSTMIIILIGAGIPTAMSKYLSEIFNTQPEMIPIIKRTGARLQLALISVVTIIYFFMAPVFAALLKDPTLTPLFRLSSFIIPAFALASFYFSYYTGIQQFNKQAILKFTRSITKVVFIVGLGLYFKAAGAVIGQALAPFTVFIDAYLLDPYRKKAKKLPTQKEMKYEFHWKKLLNFAWPITIFMIFYELMISMDLYLVKAILHDDIQTGLYNAALTVGRIPYYLFYFLTIILLPKISQTTAQGLKEETKRMLQSSMRFLFMFLFPTVALLATFADSSIRFFFGARYSAAGYPMSILVIGVGFLTVFYILSFVLNGAGKNKVPMWIAFIGAVVNFGLNYTLIKSMGLIGSALATTITSAVAMIICSIYTAKNLFPFIRLLQLIKYTLASLLIYFIGQKIFYQGRFIFIVWSFILFLLYLLILAFLKEINANDWKQLSALLNKKKSAPVKPET